MTDVYTPRPFLRYAADRLRQTIAEPELTSDTDLLSLLSDGYARLCERSGCLETIGSVPLVAGTEEYDYPQGFYNLKAVYLSGMRIDRLATRSALADYGGGAPVVYYSYSGRIGFQPVPASVGVATLLYEASPPVLLTYDDVLDARCLPEYRYGIVHYVRWRLFQIDGGAQGINQATYERQVFDMAVRGLKGASRGTNAVGPVRMRSITERQRALR